jgi:chromosome partitioning protein
MVYFFPGFDFVENEAERERMKTIAFSIQKGGVGKSSLSVALGEELARMGKKVLFLDADPQGSTSNWIGPEELEVELADVLLGKEELGRAIVGTKQEGFYLVPSAGQGGELREYAQRLGRQAPGRLAEVLAEVEGRGFQFCVLDLSPALGPWEWECLAAADEIVTPIQADRLSADGLAVFAHYLKNFRQNRVSGRPVYKKILLNALDRRIAQHREMREKLVGNKVFSVYVYPVEPAFRKCQAAGMFLQSLRKAKPETLEELSRLARDIVEEN